MPSSSSAEQFYPILPRQEAANDVEPVIEGGGDDLLSFELKVADECLAAARHRLQELQTNMIGARPTGEGTTPEDLVYYEEFKARVMPELERAAEELSIYFKQRQALEQKLQGTTLERPSGEFVIGNVPRPEETTPTPEINEREESSRQHVIDYFGEKLIEADARNDAGDAAIIQDAMAVLLNDPPGEVDQALLGRFIEADLVSLKKESDKASARHDQRTVDILQAQMEALNEMTKGLPEFDKERARAELDQVTMEHATALGEREVRRAEKERKREEGRRAVEALLAQQKEVMRNRDEYLADSHAFTSPLLKESNISRSNLIFANKLPAPLLEEHQALKQARVALGERPAGMFAKLLGKERDWVEKNLALERRKQQLDTGYHEFVSAREHAYGLATKLEQDGIGLGERIQRQEAALPDPNLLDEQDQELNARIQALENDMASIKERL